MERLSADRAELDTSKLDRSAIVGRVAAAVLILSLFFPWYSLSTDPSVVQRGTDQANWACGVGDSSCNGWETFPILRWLLIAAAAAPFILAWIVIRGHALSWPRGELTAIVGLTAFLLIAYNGIVDKPQDGLEMSLGIGYFLALLASIGIFISGGFRAVESGGGAQRNPPAPFWRPPGRSAGREGRSPERFCEAAACGRDLVAKPNNLAHMEHVISQDLRDPSHPDRNLALELVRVTEAGALAAGRWVGRGEKESADGAAVDAMRLMLDTVPMDGVVVIGEREKDEAPMLFNGEEIGDGSPPVVDIAVDPLEGTTLTARGQPSALSVIALSERGTMFDPGPVVYMEKIAAGPRIAECLTLDESLGDVIRKVAERKRGGVGEVTVVMLDRSRHEEAIEEIRKVGARIRFIKDGDVA